MDSMSCCFGLVTGCTTEASLTYKPSLLDQVISRGRLRCGTNGELPGFSFLDPQGRYVGLDVDICRAIAAALFDNPNAVDYESGRCQAVSADKSALIVRRSRLSQPSAHVILPETISKEPLAPAIVAGDSRWLKAISWVIYTLFEAEDLVISSTNLAQIQAGQNELLQKFLRPSDALGDNAGLPPDFPTRIIRAVGNYAEIYQRHLGSDSQFRLPRANNSLWKDGGLLYSPPFR
jgi:ABC-type amino acid transport/signal transduction systems, periplasmic component/domain